MIYKTYQEADTAAMAHYQNGEFAQALDILNQAVAQFPAHRTDADYLRSCLAVRVDNISLAYQIFDSLHEDGIWFAETIFRGSPSYAPLQGKPEFEQRVKSHAELRARAGESDPAQPHLLIPTQEGTPYPVIFHLHGNGSHPSLELPHWQPLMDAGWFIAAPVSDELFWANGNAVWPDHETAEKQLARDFDALKKKKYAMDETPIILTGFSMGGEVAMAQTLKGDIIRASGFIAVAPGGPMMDEPESFRPLIEQAQGRELRGIIMVSREDGVIEPDKAAQLAQMLNDNSIPCKFIEYPDAGHVYPSNFGTRLFELLAWITEA